MDYFSINLKNAFKIVLKLNINLSGKTLGKYEPNAHMVRNLLPRGYVLNSPMVLVSRKP